MIVTTTQNIPGYEVETLEIVFGNTVRTKHVGKDIMAGLKSIVEANCADIRRCLQMQGQKP